MQKARKFLEVLLLLGKPFLMQLMNGIMGVGISVRRYWNVSQDHGNGYLKTCLPCMQKNPVTKPEKGSRKPILQSYFAIGSRLILLTFASYGSKTHSVFICIG